MDTNTLFYIEGESKRAPKEVLIKQLDSPTQIMVKLALDPDVTFGVTAPDDDECIDMWARANTGGNYGRAMATPAWDSWFLAQLDRFRTRDLSGNAAKEMVVEIIRRAPTNQTARWAGRVINKTLRAGFDIRTFNKVFSTGKIEKFSVQLADTYEGEQLKGLWYIQPKLDGNRVILIDGKAMSRNGKEYAAAQHIVDEFNQKYNGFFDRWVVDGEMMGNLGFDQSSGALRRLSEGGRKKAEFTYWAFDLIGRKEWEARQTKPLRLRLSDLKSVVGNLDWKNVQIVPNVSMEYPAHMDIMHFCDKFVEQGFEGAMLKDAGSSYEFKRAKNLLKVKRFFDADLRVVDFYEGRGKHKGRLGGIVVEGYARNAKKVRSEVGSGFDDATREMIWKNKQSWKGATVQIQYQECTPDGSLRFPVFVMRRNDKE